MEKETANTNTIEVSWKMFEIVDTLGQGAYGDVFKVKCLQSTIISDQGTERILIDSKQVKQEKNKQTMLGGVLKPNQNKTLYEGNFYVIKVINVGILPQEMQFEALNEIDFMQSVSSPYIVGYFDSFIENQLINIIIEYCPFGDLNTLIKKQKILKKSFVDNVIWKMFINICLGVWTLHSQDIIHRDLKSLNIFMASQSVAKVGDFGCAQRLSDQVLPDSKNPEIEQDKPSDLDFEQVPKDQSPKNRNKPLDVLDGLLSDKSLNMDMDELHDTFRLLSEHKSTQMTAVNERVGTPYYLAPELWNNKSCTKASDIWALGVILYELCCHSYPFPASNEEELKNKVLNNKIEKVKHGVHPEFTQFINQMLKKDAKERPSIEEIIYNDLFQTKAQLHQITLPLVLNKQKVLHKYNIGEDLNLTSEQKKLIGIKESQPPKHTSKAQSARKFTFLSRATSRMGGGEEAKEPKSERGSKLGQTQLKPNVGINKSNYSTNKVTSSQKLQPKGGAMTARNQNEKKGFEATQKLESFRRKQESAFTSKIQAKKASIGSVNS